MDPYRGEWLILALNAIGIVLILTLPLLIGFLIIRVLRKVVSEDRRAFENEIRSKLGDIVESQAEIKRQMDELLRR